MCILLAGTGSRRYGPAMTTQGAVEIEKETGWRGSREVWLAAAKQALLEAGLDAVKIQPLASRLNIARTSFYWFFKDRPELLDALDRGVGGEEYRRFRRGLRGLRRDHNRRHPQPDRGVPRRGRLRAAFRPGRARLGAPVRGGDGAGECGGRAQAAGHSGDVRAVRLCERRCRRPRPDRLSRADRLHRDAGAGGTGGTHVARQPLRRDLLGPRRRRRARWPASMRALATRSRTKPSRPTCRPRRIALVLLPAERLRPTLRSSPSARPWGRRRCGSR